MLVIKIIDCLFLKFKLYVTNIFFPPLFQEVSKKSERITALEREKAALIRELFQSRAQNRRNDIGQDNIGFM